MSSAAIFVWHFKGKEPKSVFTQVKDQKPSVVRLVVVQMDTCNTMPHNCQMYDTWSNMMFIKSSPIPPNLTLTQTKCGLKIS